MRIICWGLLMFLICSSCRGKYDHGGRTPLVEVDGKFLYREQLDAALPPGLSAEDSSAFVSRYIRHWIEGVLLYEKAQSNVSDTAELNKQVEDYRKTLIVHNYLQALIHQELSETVSEEELHDYYQSHLELFKVDKPLIKGLFIKIPLTAPRLSEVRRWYKQNDSASVEHLEKYSLRHAVKYEYFYDRWLPLDEVMGMLPLQESDMESYIDKHRHVELKDTVFWYFLNVTDYRAVGDEAPYDYARRQAGEILLNVKQAQYVEQVKENLYERALKREKIKYYKQ